jgi:hypothetical protein
MGSFSVFVSNFLLGMFGALFPQETLIIVALALWVWFFFKGP